MSQNLVNVGGISDPHYRYRRPALKVKEELRGTNGQRTVIENIEDVCKAIHVPPSYPTQFFGYELSVSARFQEKTKEGGRTCTVLAGIHSAAVLERLMVKFELLYVVCPACKDGGARLSVSKKNGVRIKCGACGQVRPPRSPHKLEKFMIKNPPPKQDSGLVISSQSQNGKSELGAIGSVGGLESVMKSRGPDDAESAEGGGAGGAAGGGKKEKKTKGKSKKKDQKESEPDGEGKMRSEAKEPEPEVEQKIASPAEKFQEFVKSLRAEDAKSWNDVHVVELCSELDRLTLVHSLSKSSRLSTCLNALIDTSAAPKTLPSQFQSIGPVLKRLAPDRSSKLMLIPAVANRLVSHHEGSDDQNSKSQSLLSYLPMILMALYEADVVDEGAVLAWMASPPETDNWALGREAAVKARKVSKSFADWLEKEENEEE